MHNGDFFFADTKEEVVNYVGCEIEDVLSFTFISATVADNSILQKVDPRYVSWLKGLKGVDRKRLLEGNWFARETNASYFDRNNIHELEQAPPFSDFVKIVRAYDLAGTLPSDTNPNPDYTVSVKMGKLKTGDYVIIDVTRARIKFGDWKKHILENAALDGRRVDIVIPQDPGIQAKANSISLAREICEAGYSCTTRRSAEGKLEDFKPFAACAQLGTIFAVAECGNDYFNKQYNTLEFYYNELEFFTGKRSNKKEGHDDCVDATSLAFLYLASRARMPSSSFLHGIHSAKSDYVNPLLQIK
jgi:predicted phage terminase large subunit-like protein